MMKKIALTLAAMTALAGVAYGMANPDLIENVPGLNFKVSNNVKLAYKNDGSAVPQKYGIISKHSSGDTYYATSNIATALFKKQDDSYMGKTLTLADQAVTDVGAGESIFSGWLPM